MAGRVLVVEDDPDIREALTEALEIQGWEVLQARDGADGLRVARACLPDVILLDLMMPVMNGWAFRAAQRADGLLAGVPVVVVSAVDADRLADVDAEAYICKPFLLQDLFAVLERVSVRGPRPGAGLDPGAGARDA